MYKYLDYLPEYLHDVKEFQAIDGSINPQMDVLMQSSEQVYANQFLKTADLPTVKRWEKIDSIISPSSFSLESRRLKLIQRQSQKVPYTLNMLRDYLSQLFTHADASMDYARRQMNVEILMEDNTQVDNLYAPLRQMLPANMLIHITLRTELTAQTYIAASMTSYSEETMNSGFFTVLPAYPLKLGSSMTDHASENMNDTFETRLSGSVMPGGGMTDYDWITPTSWNGMENYHDASGYHNTGRTLTGSGPASWYHDGTPFGVDSLNGNVWEWVGGLRVMNGEIQIIPDNNAAEHVDQSASSTLWKAILQDGSLANPGAANSLKYNGAVAGDATQTDHYIGNPILDIKNDKPAYTGGNVNDNFGQFSCTLETLAAASGVTVPQLLKSLGLFPVDSSLNADVFYVRNYGERLPLRGGDWFDGTGAGVFSLHLINPRSISDVNVGFRSAFVKL